MQENNENKQDEMASIDPEQYKKELDNELSMEDILNDLTPIEVKSTEHIERQKAQEAKKENAVTAHHAANEVFDWLESILTAVIAIVLIFTFIVRINTVAGTSMVPTLINGQKLIVTDLFYTPSYNDIVIVQAANLDGGKPIVKRVIGLPGDTIMIDFTDGVVYRNGAALPQEVIGGVIYEDGHAINDVTLRNFEMISGQEYVVPEDCYFVMGDNRNDSRDSRELSVVGFINKNYIAGHAIFSIFPFNTFGTV